MKEKQFNNYINVGYAKNKNLSNISVYKGDKVIYENDTNTDKIRIYQYATRIFVGLVTLEEFKKCIDEVKTTEEYFNLSLDDLLRTNKESGWTKEECLIEDLGLEIVRFDDEKDLKEEREEFEEYMESHRYEIKAILRLINERIAVVLI